LGATSHGGGPGAPCGKAGAIQIRRCPGLAVDHYGGTLGALALNRSGFCNVGVNYNKLMAKSDSSLRSPFSRLMWVYKS
jgi:hypothetical protein